MMMMMNICKEERGLTNAPIVSGGGKVVRRVGEPRRQTGPVALEAQFARGLHALDDRRGGSEARHACP